MPCGTSASAATSTSTAATTSASGATSRTGPVDGSHTDTMAPMAPRTILYTGKGGVGKTSVTAGSARRCAASGLRTVVLSTDPAHSLSDSFEAELGSSPTPCGDNLWGQEVQAQEEMERHWEAVQ